MIRWQVSKWEDFSKISFWSFAEKEYVKLEFEQIAHCWFMRGNTKTILVFEDCFLIDL
jgi:hypothetical protein